MRDSLAICGAHGAQKYESPSCELWSPSLATYQSKIDYFGYQFRANVDYHYCTIAKGSNLQSAVESPGQDLEM